MKRIGIFLTCLLFCFGLSLPVSAHVLQIDRSIGAVLHVDPEDDPIAGSTSSFFLEFKDKQGQFSLPQCSCVATISQHGKEIFTQHLTSSAFSFTFPGKDVYPLDITGAPTVPNAFQSFHLHYDIRVAREATTAPSTSQFSLNPILFVLISLSCGGIVFLFMKRRHEVSRISKDAS